jgi:hypothetical protein
MIGTLAMGISMLVCYIAPPDSGTDSICIVVGSILVALGARYE